jgi:hypothetical protein
VRSSHCSYFRRADKRQEDPLAGLAEEDYPAVLKCTKAEFEALSKNEKKRRLKEFEKAKASADKAKTKAAAAPAPEKKKDDTPALEEDEDIPPEKFKENREAWVEKQKKDNKNPYPHKFHTTMQLPTYHAKYNSVEPGGFADAVEGVAGARARHASERVRGAARASARASAWRVPCGGSLRPYHVQALGRQGARLLRRVRRRCQVAGLCRRA